MKIYNIVMSTHASNGDVYNETLLSLDGCPDIKDKKRILFLLKDRSPDMHDYNLLESQLDELLKNGYSDNFEIEPREVYSLSF